jgi:hypothetical protein
MSEEKENNNSEVEDLDSIIIPFQSRIIENKNIGFKIKIDDADAEYFLKNFDLMKKFKNVAIKDNQDITDVDVLIELKMLQQISEIRKLIKKEQLNLLKMRVQEKVQI